MIEVEAKKLIQQVPDSENQVFTDSQYFLFKNLSSSLKYSFSGPTSMGKSFIIKAFIRKVIKNESNLELLFDFDDYPVFDDATTYPIIYILNRQKEYKDD